MTTLTIKPAVTFASFRNALRNVLQTSDNAFLNKIYGKDFSIEPISINEVEIHVKHIEQSFRALVAGKKVVLLNGKNSKASVNIGLTRQVVFNEFLKNENGYVIDLEEHTVKAVVVSTGWIPADDILDHLTYPALITMNTLVMVSSKGSSGEIEHFVFSGDKSYATTGIKEVRSVLNEIVEENGGYIVEEQAPKARKPRTISFNSMETSKGTTAEAWRVESATRRVHRQACKEVAKEAKLAQKIRDRRNVEALMYA